MRACVRAWARRNSPHSPCARWRPRLEWMAEKEGLGTGLGEEGDAAQCQRCAKQHAQSKPSDFPEIAGMLVLLSSMAMSWLMIVAP
jgi:hypothetical protein